MKRADIYHEGFLMGATFTFALAFIMMALFLNQWVIAFVMLVFEIIGVHIILARYRELKRGRNDDSDAR